MEKFGVIFLSHVSLKSKSSHTSEVISQALFGEAFLMIGIEEKWTKIKLLQDGYTGWIQNNQWKPIDNPTEYPYSLNLQDQKKIKIDKYSIRIPIGAILWDKSLLKKTFVRFHIPSTFKTAFPNQTTSNKKIIKTAKKFLGSPYMWGGKTSAGIDCSGLVQVVFSVNGIQLPRDAYQQALIGEDIPFEDCKTGDLAFFSENSEKISHVGIIIRNKKNVVKIIHSSAYVKIDYLNQNGIIQKSENENKQYTHQLVSIKRVLTQ